MPKEEIKSKKIRASKTKAVKKTAKKIGATIIKLELEKPDAKDFAGVPNLTTPKKDLTNMPTSKPTANPEIDQILDKVDEQLQNAKKKVETILPTRNLKIVGGGAAILALAALDIMTFHLMFGGLAIFPLGYLAYTLYLLYQHEKNASE